MNNTLNITQPTRKAARLTTKNFIKAGKLAKVLDNGKQFTANDRWSVEVVIVNEVSKTGARRVGIKKQKAFTNKGFDIRPVTTGIKGYDLFLDGEFILRRGTRISVYEKALQIARKNKLDYSSLNYK